MKKWSVAYNFNLNDEIDINEAMELRIGKDPRAGDLHCHKSCFEGKSGSRLLTIRKAINRKAHFRRWPGEYTKANTNCSYQNISDSKRESMDYSQFYIRFQNFINGESKNTEPYFIHEINMEPVGEFAPDFTIYHTKNNPYGFSQTKIHIIDENKRRRKKIGLTRVEGNVAIIVIRISEYTPEQLKNFKRGGIEKFELNWKYVIKDTTQKKNPARTKRSELLSHGSVRGKDLRGVDLNGADLSRVDLYRACMTGVDLTGADLSYANLHSADLRNARMSNVNLTPGYLFKANLTDADLTGADLRNAYLGGANLAGANLTGADLTAADLTDVTWNNTTCPDGTNSNDN